MKRFGVKDRHLRAPKAYKNRLRICKYRHLDENIIKKIMAAAYDGSE